MRSCRFLLVLALATAGCSSGDEPMSDDEGDACHPTDADGIEAGDYTFVVAVNDQGYTPRILKSQNLGNITLTLKNVGSKPHDLVIDCIPIDAPGCPKTSCFPATANVTTVVPGETATTTFTVPYVEGIYTFRSDVGADSTAETDGGVTGIWGQYVVQ